jgi:hypothetical protein
MGLSTVKHLPVNHWLQQNPTASLLEAALDKQQLRKVVERIAMLSVEGTFQNGVVQLNQPIAGRNGQKVMIVFLQDENESALVSGGK